MENPDRSSSRRVLPPNWSLEEESSKRHVICLICHEWVISDDTVVVVGQQEARAHICLKHLKK